jgi:hypothetical protein
MAATIKINTDSLKERRDWKRHAVNDGENVYRVLPPFGDESNGYPYRRWVVAWLNDPSSGRKRPYASTRSFGEEGCPVTEYCAALEKKRDAIEASLKASGVDKDTIKEKLKVFGQILWEIKPKTTYIYNAVNKAGEVGLLELKKTAHDGMKKQMMQYITDYGQDPTSLNSTSEDSGVWFKIKREGEGVYTEYSVQKNQTKKKTSEGLVFVDDRSELPQNVVENYDSVAYDLNTVYKRHSYSELKEVLMSNLVSVYAKYPVAKIDGFVLETEDSVPFTTDFEKKQTLSAAKPISLKKPVLRFDDDEEEDAVVAQDAAPAKPSTKNNAFKNNEDIFDYAESILNS